MEKKEQNWQLLQNLRSERILDGIDPTLSANLSQSLISINTLASGRPWSTALSGSIESFLSVVNPESLEHGLPISRTKSADPTNSGGNTVGRHSAGSAESMLNSSPSLPRSLERASSVGRLLERNSSMTTILESKIISSQNSSHRSSDCSHSDLQEVTEEYSEPVPIKKVPTLIRLNDSPVGELNISQESSLSIISDDSGTESGESPVADSFSPIRKPNILNSSATQMESIVEDCERKRALFKSNHSETHTQSFSDSDSQSLSNSHDSATLKSCLRNARNARNSAHNIESLAMTHSQIDRHVHIDDHPKNSQSDVSLVSPQHTIIRVPSSGKISNENEEESRHQTPHFSPSPKLEVVKCKTVKTGPQTHRRCHSETCIPSSTRINTSSFSVTFITPRMKGLMEDEKEGLEEEKPKQILKDAQEDSENGRTKVLSSPSSSESSVSNHNPTLSSSRSKLSDSCLYYHNGSTTNRRLSRSVPGSPFRNSPSQSPNNSPRHKAKVTHKSVRELSQMFANDVIDSSPTHKPGSPLATSSRRQEKSFVIDGLKAGPVVGFVSLHPSTVEQIQQGADLSKFDIHQRLILKTYAAEVESSQQTTDQSKHAATVPGTSSESERTTPQVSAGEKSCSNETSVPQNEKVTSNRTSTESKPDRRKTSQSSGSERQSSKPKLPPKPQVLPSTRPSTRRHSCVTPSRVNSHAPLTRTSGTRHLGCTCNHSTSSPVAAASKTPKSPAVQSGNSPSQRSRKTSTTSITIKANSKSPKPSPKTSTPKRNAEVDVTKTLSPSKAIHHESRSPKLMPSFIVHNYDEKRGDTKPRHRDVSPFSREGSRPIRKRKSNASSQPRTSGTTSKSSSRFQSERKLGTANNLLETPGRASKNKTHTKSFSGSPSTARVTTSPYLKINSNTNNNNNNSNSEEPTSCELTLQHHVDPHDRCTMPHTPSQVVQHDQETGASTQHVSHSSSDKNLLGKKPPLTRLRRSVTTFTSPKSTDRKHKAMSLESESTDSSETTDTVFIEDEKQQSPSLKLKRSLTLSSSSDYRELLSGLTQFKNKRGPHEWQNFGLSWRHSVPASGESTQRRRSHFQRLNSAPSSDSGRRGAISPL